MNPARLYAALGVGALILALVVGLLFTRARLDHAREQIKSERLSHGVTLQSLKGVTAAIRDQNAKVRELDRLGQAARARAAGALKEAQSEAEKLRGPLDRLKASAASVRAPDAPCTVSDAVRAVEGEI